MKAKVTRSESEVYEVKFTREDLVGLAKDRVLDDQNMAIYDEKVRVNDRDDPSRNDTVIVTVTLEKVINPKEELL